MFIKLILILTIITLIKCENKFKYEAPDDCQWTVSRNNQQNNEEVSLQCNVRSINSEIDSTNFSVIPSEYTTSLTFKCNQTLYSKSTLPNRSFIHLQRLKQFKLKYCKLLKLSSESLFGLYDLRNLTIQTYNDERKFEIEKLSFIHIKQLENLDLTYNNLWAIPEGLFCPLINLISLNISHNNLQDIDDFGFRKKLDKNEDDVVEITETTTKQTCSLDLQVLDASYNSFGHIPSRSLSALRRLNELRITNNDLTSISDKALNGLKSLRIFDVSNNKLVALPPTLFIDNGDIRELYLQNNSLGALSPGLLSNLKHLLSLDLSRNRLSSAWLDINTFSGLIRLVLLDLSNNRITTLNPEYFKDLYTLQILNLEHNLIENIQPNSFTPMNNLHTLILSNNKIKTLEVNIFSGLYALSLLALDNNKLNYLHIDSLRNCTSLQDINLNDNELEQVPDALYDMRLLKTIDLGENKIKQLDQPGFKGMTNLYGLRLIGNEITNLSRQHFIEMPSIQILNLARNKINKIELGTFDTNLNLQAVRLDANELIDISGLLNGLNNLIWLNISDNKLTWFDYSQVPMSLQWLDLHKNNIKEISDRRQKMNEIQLQTLDLSHNLLTHIGIGHLPPKIEILFLNDNQIKHVDTNTFTDKINLTRVDLYANQIENMDLSALRLTPVNNDKKLPEFYIGGNPYQCDCTMEWLQRINKLELRQHPRVMDIENIYCKLTYNRHQRFISLTEADSSHFVCKYDAHCFALCHCCDFDACDCKMQCPSNCTCYHDQSWSAANIVDCSSTNHLRIPATIPMDATEVYLDGNSFGELRNHQFIGRKNLKSLYLNASNIIAIRNNTFSGLKRLQKLYLQDNYITELHGYEFDCNLNELREIYLQNNKIIHINNSTFTGLNQLEVIRLDNNRLHNFPIWTFILNPYLTLITLKNNNWSCNCEYIQEFRTWLNINIPKVSDGRKLKCIIQNNDGPFITDFNSTACNAYISDPNGFLNNLSRNDIIINRAIRNYIPLIIAIIIAFAIVLCLIFMAAYHRKQLRLWMYSRCGVKICYFTTSTNHHHNNAATIEEMEERNKAYDIFISYSISDESYVTQILCNSLDPNLRICLQHNRSNLDSLLLDNMENSRRIVIVLSTFFLIQEWRRPEFRSTLKEYTQRDFILKKRKNKRNNNKLIFIILNDIPSRDLDPDLRMYLNNSLCINWGDKKFWQKLRTYLPSTTPTTNEYKTTPTSDNYNCCFTTSNINRNGRNYTSVICPSSSIESSSQMTNNGGGGGIYEYSSIIGSPSSPNNDIIYETIHEPVLTSFIPSHYSTIGRNQQQQTRQQQYNLWA